MKYVFGDTAFGKSMNRLDSATSKLSNGGFSVIFTGSYTVHRLFSSGMDRLETRDLGSRFGCCKSPPIQYSHAR